MPNPFPLPILPPKNMTQSASVSFFEKSPAAIRAELAGFPLTAVDAALRFRTSGNAVDFHAMILAQIAFYRPGDRTEPLDSLPPETRFRDELGLDSLTLTEMVFKFDELLGVEIEIREAAQLQTLGELQEFLCAKLGLWSRDARQE